MNEKWRHTFELDFPVYCIFDPHLQVISDDGNWDDYHIPKGCVAIIDAEMEVVAYVPDKIALESPDRKLAPLLVQVLEAAANGKFADDEDDRDIKMIGIEMVDAGLPYDFVLRILSLSKESEGVEDVVHLWAEAPDVNERRECERTLREMTKDREPHPQ
jgi:hypothetical protein